MISKLVIVGLILLWTVVLLPDVLQRINRGRRGDTIRSFNSQLTSLGRSQGTASGNLPSGNRVSGNVIDLRSRIPGADAAPPAHEPVGAPHARVPDEASRQSPPPRSAPANPPAVRRTPAAPRPVSPAVRKRRQDVMVSLAAVALLTLLATVAFGSAFLYMHLLADVLLATYLVLLVRAGATQPVTPTPAVHARTGTRRDPGLAPIGPLSAVSTATVSSPRPLDPQRIAN